MAVRPTLQMRVQEGAALLKSEEAGKLNRKILVPVCSWCDKIRDPEGEWLTLEDFLRKYFNAVCTHTICEGCREQHFPDFS